MGTVCKATFKSFYEVGDRYIQSCLRLIGSKTLIIPKHGNTGHLRNLDATKRQAIVEYLLKVREEQGEEYALRVHTRKQKDGVITKSVTTRDIIMLPCSLSINKLLILFNQTRKEAGLSETSRRTLRKVWKAHDTLKDMIIRSPSADECEICVAYKHLRRPSACTTEEHAESQRCYDKHKEQYRAMRKMYEDDCRAARMSALLQDRKFACLSFDFAQSAEVPYQPQQIGPFYFLSPYKIFPFGVVDEATDIAHHLCYGEDVQGKGGNQVVSLLYHYLKNLWPARQKMPEELALWADNCAGQNKNKTMMWFLAWLVQQPWGPKRVRLCFQIKGHTRNSVDRHFGDVKRLYMRSGIWLIEDFLKVVKESTKTGNNVPVNLFKEKEVFLQWDQKLSPLLAPVTGIAGYQVFRFEREMSGLCFAKHGPFTEDVTIDLCVSASARAQLADPSLPAASALLGAKAEKIVYFFNNFTQYIPIERKTELSKLWWYKKPTGEQLLIAKESKTVRKEAKEDLMAVGKGQPKKNRTKEKESKKDAKESGAVSKAAKDLTAALKATAVHQRGVGDGPAAQNAVGESHGHEGEVQSGPSASANSTGEKLALPPQTPSATAAQAARQQQTAASTPMQEETGETRARSTAACNAPRKQRAVAAIKAQEKAGEAARQRGGEETPRQQKKEEAKEKEEGSAKRAVEESSEGQSTHDNSRKRLRSMADIASAGVPAKGISRPLRPREGTSTIY